MSTTSISRRSFLRKAGVLGVATAAGKTLLDVFVPLGRAEAATQLPLSGDLPLGTPILVVIDLQGGNDFLNTLVPLSDSWYRDPTYGRGGLAIPEADVLPLTGTTYGVHPSLAWLAGRWGAGDVAFVHGTGENVAREFSHFAAMAYRNTADFNRSNPYGWLGRYNDRVAASSAYASVSTDGLHPSLLSSTVPILQVRDCAAMSFSSDHRYRTGYLSAIEAMAASSSHAPGMLGAAATNHHNVFQAVGRVTAAAKASYNRGTGSSVEHQLAQVAMLIDAGLPSQTYVVTTGGYDTHGSQAWQHGDLLAKLNAGLSWFFGIVDGTARAKDVFVLITSEFGRQVSPNASGGLDHGQAGGMLVLGGGVKGGLYGQPPTLDPGGPTRPNRINDALVPTVDFRDVYATVLNRLGKDSALTAEVLGGPFADLGIFYPGAGTASTTTTAPATTTPPTTAPMATTTTTMPLATTTTTMATTTTTMAPTTTTTMPPATGPVLDIKAPGVVFNPAQTTYTVPLNGKTSIPVTVTLANTTDLLYIAGNPAKSGKEVNVWMGRGSASIVVYDKRWRELARYTLVAG